MCPEWDPRAPGSEGLKGIGLSPKGCARTAAVADVTAWC